jgi:hypothetical protein
MEADLALTANLDAEDRREPILFQLSVHVCLSWIPDEVSPDQKMYIFNLIKLKLIMTRIGSSFGNGAQRAFSLIARTGERNRRTVVEKGCG